MKPDFRFCLLADVIIFGQSFSLVNVNMLNSNCTERFVSLPGNCRDPFWFDGGINVLKFIFAVHLNNTNFFSLINHDAHSFYAERTFITIQELHNRPLANKPLLGFSFKVKCATLGDGGVHLAS